MGRWQTVATGRTRIATFQVWTLDVWGHLPSECCAEYDCACIGTCDDDGEGVEHDENECTCSCDVNDRARAGAFELVEHEIAYNLDSDGKPTPGTWFGWDASDAATCDAAGVSADCVIEWQDRDYADIEAPSGRPLLQIERIKGDE